MHTNRLAREKSPYLLQHAHNPVDWFAWGEEAFEKARGEDKPIFLSIGYSTCHWCHVMERESFESEEIADVLNRSFVPVKLDREERPDIDRIYMMFVQATTSGGGWPMSVFLTPELKPFFGGTYFPPENRYGRPGFKTILEHLAAAWVTDRTRILESAANVTESLRQYAAVEGGGLIVNAKEVRETLYLNLRRS
ncbi:MAG: thioredoxin domain-containing protein, partial [Bryobacter sp.]|nr:thioredoxin domain-containing protein [Bryobacter sp.]